MRTRERARLSEQQRDREMAGARGKVALRLEKEQKGAREAMQFLDVLAEADRHRRRQQQVRRVTMKKMFYVMVRL